jgi:hypothetical protein
MTFWACVALAVTVVGVAIMWSALREDQRRRAYVSDETRAHLAADDNNDNPDLL